MSFHCEHCGVFISSLHADHCPIGVQIAERSKYLFAADVRRKAAVEAFLRSPAPTPEQLTENPDTRRP